MNDQLRQLKDWCLDRGIDGYYEEKDGRGTMYFEMPPGVAGEELTLLRAELQRRYNDVRTALGAPKLRLSVMSRPEYERRDGGRDRTTVEPLL